MPGTHPTRLFESYEAWDAAGRPIGGVFPVSAADALAQAKAGGIPARYQGVEMYYVALPNAEETRTAQLWCPGMKAYNAEQGWHGDGWNIEGPPDRMSITPSIQTASWHGYLTDGALRAC